MKNLKKSFVLLLAAMSSTLIYSCAGSDYSQSAPIIPIQAPATTQSIDSDLIGISSAPYTGQIINTVFHGTVTEQLPDDTSGLKHEKFMFKLIDGANGKYNGQTVLVAHDTDRAPVVPLKVGDTLEIKGDFLPDATPTKVLHWTHHDEKHKHADGYIKLNGKVYQ